ncbi:MAG: MbnP family protein [Saprospiraceae bacterium]
MKKLLLLSFALMVVLIIGCDPDPGTPEPTTTTLSLNFDGQFGDDELVLFQYYDYQNGDSVFINVAHFFVSNITLLNGTEETMIKDIDVLDFTNNHLEANGEPEKIIIEDVPVGNYTGIRIGLGVDSILNHTIPADYALGHPLANASEYWDWRETYIFGKFEGKIKESPDSSFFYAYHPGTDELYRTPTFTKTISLEGGVEASINFTIDFEKLFQQGNDKIDIKNNSISHTGQADLWLATLIMDNLEAAIEIE